MITLFTIPNALFIVLRRTAVEDSGRLLGKVDAAAPGKAASGNAYLTFSPVFKQAPLYAREFALHKVRPSTRYDHRDDISLINFLYYTVGS